MNWVATCTDCRWTFEGDDQIEAADAMERHSRKERHHVDIKRQQVA
ncbi:MAG: hypothetical protein ABEJ84_03235 [Halodesulfurarchaeum sp.]